MRRILTVKQVGEETLYLEPQTEDESKLVQMLFERITEFQPVAPLGDRTDIAMAMFATVKKWAHDGESVKTIN